MSDHEERSNEEEREEQAQPPPTSGVSAVAAHMLANKVDAALWATRGLSLILSILYFIPIFSPSEVTYQKVLMSNAATSALRLHQRVSQGSFNRQFIMLVLKEDSAHYLLYSLNFLLCEPMTLVILPVMLFAVLHFASYSLSLFDIMGENNSLAPRFLISMAEFQQRNILRAAAFIEIFLMPLTVINLFYGRVLLATPIVYYQFLSLRYQSRRNPFNRMMFHELRVATENLAAQPNVPGMIRSLLLSSINRISSLAPVVVEQ